MIRVTIHATSSNTVNGISQYFQIGPIPEVPICMPPDSRGFVHLFPITGKPMGERGKFIDIRYPRDSSEDTASEPAVHTQIIQANFDLRPEDEELVILV